jgi:hypothetical protein
MDDEVYGDEPTELNCTCPDCTEVMYTDCTCWQCDGTHTCPDCLRDTL